MKELYAKPTRVQAVVQMLRSLLFLGSLLVPLLFTPLAPVGKQQGSRGEQLAAFPDLRPTLGSFKSFPNRCREYVEDHFGFRNDLIYWHALLKLRCLGVSPSDQVLVGKNGWYFLTNTAFTQEFHRSRPLTDAELATWQRVLEERRDWLAARGIGYLFVIAPEKHTIYPEYLPDYLPRAEGTSRMDQLFGYLRQHSDLDIVDLRPALRAAKAKDVLYIKSDAHWNEVGAHVAYQTIAEKLQRWLPHLRPAARSGFRRVESPFRQGDVARLLAMGETLPDTTLRLVPIRPRLARDEQAKLPLFGEQSVITVRQGDALPRAVIFRDSFVTDLGPFLSEDFQRATYQWTAAFSFDRALVERERPSLVIQQQAERQLLMHELPEH
jgi:alginate O-acetyltransferase complex protein AlgJ